MERMSKTEIYESLCVSILSALKIMRSGLIKNLHIRYYAKLHAELIDIALSLDISEVFLQERREYFEIDKYGFHQHQIFKSKIDYFDIEPLLEFGLRRARNVFYGMQTNQNPFTGGRWTNSTLRYFSEDTEYEVKRILDGKEPPYWKERLEDYRKKQKIKLKEPIKGTMKVVDRRSLCPWDKPSWDDEQQPLKITKKFL